MACCILNFCLVLFLLPSEKATKKVFELMEVYIAQECRSHAGQEKTGILKQANSVFILLDRCQLSEIFLV